jgi:hypothetical protein
MNMTPKGLGTEAWSRETLGTWTEDVEACTTRSSVQIVEKTTSRAHKHKGASQQLTEKHRGARRAEPGQNGPGPVGPGRPAQPDPSPVRSPFCPRCLPIYCLCLRRPPHPSFHQRAAETKEKHWEEVVGRRESSSCLGDVLGHDLSTMVCPVWWSHGGVPEPRLEFFKSFVPSTFGDVIISCHTLIYYELYLFICVATICH